MNIEKFYCQNSSCAEATLYSGVKPRFCAFCGQSFAVFSSAVVAPKPTAPAPQDNNPFFKPTPTIRPASYYRNKSKAKEQELEDDLDNDIEDDDGELGEFGADSGESLQQLFGQGLMKRNKGVKFGDIISKETIVNEQPKQSKVAADKSKSKAKVRRPRKKG